MAYSWAIACRSFKHLLVLLGNLQNTGLLHCLKHIFQTRTQDSWPPERTGEMRGSLQAGEPAAGLCAACEHLTSETGSSRMLAPATRESWRLLRTGERRAPLGRPFLQLPESGALVPTSIPPTPAPDQRDD